MEAMDLSSSTNQLQNPEFYSIFDHSAMNVDSNFDWRNSSENVAPVPDVVDFSSSGLASHGASEKPFSAPVAPLVAAPVVGLASPAIDKTFAVPNPLLHSLPKVEVRSANAGNNTADLRRSKRASAIAAANILIPAAAAALQPVSDTKGPRKYTRRANAGKSSSEFDFF